MNTVIMGLTRHALLGKRRAFLLLGLPALLLVVAGLVRWGSGGDPAVTAGVAGNFAMGTLLPLLCLLVGTGVVGPEIEDGSIVYMLAKPIPRRTIALSKLTVAIVTSLALGVVPTMTAVAIAGDQDWELTLAYGVASTLAAIAYTTIFFALAILTRSAVIVGLIYALLWESVLGGYVPGIRAVSVRQWALSPAEALLRDHPSWGVQSEVGIGTGLVMLVIVTVGAAIVAVRKLQTLTVRSGE